MQQCGRGSLMNAITQKEAGIFDQLTFRCEYPNWRSALNREFPKAERCDAPAAFIVIHHHCLEGRSTQTQSRNCCFAPTTPGSFRTGG